MNAVRDIQSDFLSRVAEGLQIRAQGATAGGGDILEWVDSQHLVNERGGPFDFSSDHLFLAEIMRDMNPRQAIRKCSQVGISTSLFLKEAAVARLYSYSIIHTMPTIALLNFFVSQKVETVIRNNRSFAREFDRTGSAKQRKKIGFGWIMFLGTKGENEEISHTSDLNVYDEYDKSDLATMEGMRSRLKASRYQGIWVIGNPEIADGGVSAAYDASDQKHWFHRCGRCGKWFFNDFFNCVDFDNECYICPRCHRPLREEDRAKGVWVRKWRNREASGYWINHMMAPWITARSMIEDYFTLPEEKFYTYNLGMAPPHMDSRITADLILRNCITEPYERGRAFMGVDVGAKFHCVIGNERGVIALEVLDNPHDSGWPQLDELMQRHRVKVCVVDKLPSPDEAMAFANRHPGKVYVQVQSRDMRVRETIRYDKGGDPIVHLDKNELVSLALKKLQQGEIRFFMAHDHPLLSGRVTKNQRKDYNCFIGQASTLTKERVEDVNGNVKYRWKASPKKDHFFMAFCYYLAARERDREVQEIYEPETARTRRKEELAMAAMRGEAWYYL